MKGALRLGKRIAAEVLPPFLYAGIREIYYRVAGPPVPPAFAESLRNVENDEYIWWLSHVVGGWLKSGSGNIGAFDHAVRHMPSGGAIVEIGSFLGLSTNIIAYLADKYRRDNPFFSCDPWTFEGTERPIGGYFDASTEAYRQYAKRVFVMNTELFSGQRKPFAIEISSETFFDLWRSGAPVTDVFGRAVTLGGEIAFAYIDGAHTYEAAKADFLGVDEHLLPGGFLLLDDTAAVSQFGSRRVAEEIAAHPSYEIVFLTPHYFFQKKGRV